MIKNFTLPVLCACILIFVSCKKDTATTSPVNNNNNNNNPVQGRTVNAFGQPLADSASCLKKFYNTSPDSATVYHYDANKLLVKVVAQVGFNGATDSSVVDYFYDNLNRLIKVQDLGGAFILDYGNSPDKVQRIIKTQPNPSIADTMYCYYPDAFTIVASHINHSNNTELRDSLTFDANYNLIRSAFVVGPQGGPFAPSKIQTTTFSSTVKAVFYPSAQQEYLLFYKMLQGMDFDIWPIGRNMGIDTYVYDYTTYAPDISVDHMFIVNHQNNTENFPTYTKYQEDFIVGGWPLSGLIIYNYEYVCN